MSTSEPVSSPSPSMTPLTRSRLGEVRRALLRLHKSLLDTERTAYEQVYGRVASGGELLQLVIRDPWFAWLRPLSETIVRIDEMEEASDPPASETDAVALLGEVRALLRSSADDETFGRKYQEALQRDPDSILAHAETMRHLPPEPVA